MIYKFREIVPNKLYRGSAPTPYDVKWLKDTLNINKIVSLDEIVGQKIDRTCKLLGIEHIMLPINLHDFKRSLFAFLQYDLKDLLVNGPTFIHCREGKDRTGFVTALFQCKYLGKEPETAIKEAKELGFGVNVPEQYIKPLEKIIRSCKPSDINNADIVSNEREYVSDNRDSSLQEAKQLSFAPYLSQTKQNPMDSVYLEINDQSPTRENYDQKLDYKGKADIPQIGEYNNNAGQYAVGPTLNTGGFIYD